MDLHPKNSIAIGTIAFFTLLVGLAGCLKIPSLKQSEQTPEYFLIDYPTPEPVTSQPLAGVLLIRGLQAPALYASDRIVAQNQTYAKEFYYYKRWAANPASMLSNVLFRDLAGSGLFRAVLGGPGYLIPDYELTGTIQLFEPVREAEGWQAKLKLYVLVFPYTSSSRLKPAGSIVQRLYSAEVPCPTPTAEEFVAALSQCMNSVSVQICSDLRQYLAASGSVGPGSENRMPGTR